ncbi:serine carboxypeptidase-like 45 [Chenopodium quinoa]|uniref:serine carboxypeptidase-like 45 n=1 Tax=Chenopodium quinoa TaxID=63459 RepID=UPI000B790159|nr:serine carboxypeptidase-like 45 [Chenopodium quinoa]
MTSKRFRVESSRSEGARNSVVYMVQDVEGTSMDLEKFHPCSVLAFFLIKSNRHEILDVRNSKGRVKGYRWGRRRWSFTITEPHYKNQPKFHLTSSITLSQYSTTKHNKYFFFLSFFHKCSKMLSFTKVITFATLLLCNFALQVTPLSSEDDKITSLPGQPPVNFQQFSGYITVDEVKKRNLFYYFVQAETNPSSKPLVLWLNGGPGCSSIGAGAFSEHGPFSPSGNGLIKNEFSWNKEANMLYLESPAGVGFSYSVNKSFYNGVNDEMTARDNLVFLQKFLAKYPEYKNRDLFLTGESYGGHYVPQLANLVLKSSLKSNLKGVAIGNPLLEFNNDFNSRAEYLWSHGLISDATYEISEKICNYSQIRRQSQKGFFSAPCKLVISQINSEIGKFIDSYDVTLDVCLHSVSQQAHVLNQMMDEEKIDVCLDDETTQYLNRKDVQKAMHAHLIGVTQWATCSNVLNYHMDDLEVPTLPLLGTFTKSGVRVLIYSGDQDSVVPFIGSRTLINGLAKELGLNTTVPYRTWLTNRQVGGWTQVYGDILAYATIRGASHEAPLSQPARSLVLFRSFLDGKPLPDVSLAQ